MKSLFRQQFRFFVKAEFFIDKKAGPFVILLTDGRSIYGPILCLEMKSKHDESR
jgi:hypothetical protein